MVILVSLQTPVTIGTHFHNETSEIMNYYAISAPLLVVVEGILSTLLELDLLHRFCK